MSEIDIVKQGERVDLCLEDQNGKEWCLDEHGGRWVILYFYPRDNTPGCTKEASDFSCHFDDFVESNASMVGVSPDSGASHPRFIGKHDLKLTLLSDPDHRVMKMFDVWKPKKLYGKEFMGVARSTFIIDPEGRIRREWRRVKVKGHVEEVLSALRELQGARSAAGSNM